MRVLPLLLPLALLSLALTSPTWAQSGDFDPSRPVDPVLIEVTEAPGPPEESCKQARARAQAEREGREYVPVPIKEGVASNPPEPKKPEPDYEKMVKLVLDGTSTTLADLPGSKPEDLPLQPIEGSPEALASIANVMKRAEAGERVRMSFWGASHTSADWWTGRIRRTLQDRYGDLGHGFIFPAALYKGYRGQDINLCRTDDWKSEWVGRRGGRDDGYFGFGGASVSSTDASDFGWIETTRTNPHGRSISQVEIYSLGQPGGGGLRIIVDGQEPVVIETQRDDIELLRHRVTMPEGRHRVELRPVGNGEVRLFGVSAEREGPGILVDAIGIRGREARTWLSWDERLMGPGIASMAPDLVVLAYGTNEANDTRYSVEKYKEDLSKVLDKLHAARPDAACLLVGPSDRGKKLGTDTYAIWDRTKPIAMAQREVAIEHGCGFWDWQAATGGEGSMVAWSLLEPNMGSRDLIHFSREGYEWSADQLIAAMDQLAGIKR